MKHEDFRIFDHKVILRTEDRVCETPNELFESSLFREILWKGLKKLEKKGSPLLTVFGKSHIEESDLELFIKALQMLVKLPLRFLPSLLPETECFRRDPVKLNDLVEYLYNFWRSFDRFLICTSQKEGPDKRPYRTFNATVETLTHLVRSVYRDIQENITEKHPQIYRQLPAGANIAGIAVPKDIPFPHPFYKEKLASVPVLRQVLLNPPLIFNPPMNKRSGRFERVFENPLKRFDLNSSEWLCYPAKVGPLLILVYFHEKFFELGFSLSNLFELATDEDLEKTPDAIYAFGVPGNVLDNLASYPTVFFDDEDNGILVAACPNRDEFGYFGYLKKMVLTLHNIVMMKRGRFPFHGAFVKIALKNGIEKTVLLIGDTAAGKSETLEALRVLSEEYLREITIIADDMGSLEIDADGNIIGYGTEIGAFLRLDDLQKGYAFGQIDRAIIMSPSQVNARIVIPVTTYDVVIKGHPVDIVLYANNYEDVDEDHPIIQRFRTPEEALHVFREGAAMSKGTTTSTGIVHSYFANIFGPPQYRELHESIARRFFEAFFERGIFVGEMRTRLGLEGFETRGPEEAAKVLLAVISGQGAF